MKLLTLTVAVVLLASGMASADSRYSSSQPPRRLLFAARPAEQLPAPQPDAGPPPQPYTYHPQLQQRAPAYSPYSMIRYDGQPPAPAPKAQPAPPAKPAPAPTRPTARVRRQPPEFLPPPVLGSP